jgi:aspartyl-tRNA synthetase
MRIYNEAALEHIGEEITVSGWVNSRRDHGGLIFIDVRDHTGVLQLVIQPSADDAFKKAEQLRDEYVITAVGSVRERADHLKNPNIATGSIELYITDITILNKSEALPIQVNTDQVIGEDLRLKYRYLDLRRTKMQTLLRQRSEYNKLIRQYIYRSRYANYRQLKPRRSQRLSDSIACPSR